MRFEILGPLRAVGGDAEVDLGGPRQQRVLAVLLAAAPDAVSVDRLIDEVWGETPPGTASHVVRTYLSNLKRATGDRVVSDGQHYRISLNGDSIDAVEFGSALSDARSYFPADPLRVSKLLRESSRLWRGRPFGNLGDDAPLLERRSFELEETRMQSTELLVEAELALGHHEQVLPELEGYVSEHPLRERLHRALMLGLYRSDRQADALRVGWSLRTALVEELGIEPSAETRALEDRILVQDSRLDLRPPTNLPAFVSSFVGRRIQMAEVSKLLDVDRLVTLVGVGGVGKTRLARQVARAMLDRFPDGVWWTDLATLPPDGSPAAKTAEVFDLAEQPGVDVVALLGRFLAQRHCLLILDNCEHVVDAVAVLASELLEQADDLTVLATSRKALRTTGEARYVVPPMSLPIGTTGTSDAERLFVERATQIDGDFLVTDHVQRDIADICRVLEGLPLAIEMAAGCVNTLSPGEIARRASGHGELVSEDAGAPERHRSLSATIDWSYRLLSAQQQALFDRLSVFVGSFDITAANAIAGWDPLPTGDVDADLAALVDASMVATERSPAGWVRYRLLGSLRSYGRARLSERGEPDVVGQLHSRYFLGAIEEAASAWFTPEHSPAMESVATMNDDLLAALEWSLDHEDRSATLGAAVGLVGYWFWRGDPANAYRYGKRMLDGSDGVSDHLRAAGLLCVGFGSQLIGDFAGGGAAVAEAVRLLESTDEWKLLLWAYNGQGQGGVFLGLPDLVTEMGLRILEVCDRHGARLPRAYGLALLGESEFFGDGDFEVARRSFSEAIPLFRELGDDAGLTMFGLGVLGATEALMLDFESAERHATEASTSGGSGWSATGLIILGGYVLHGRGEIDRAELVTRRGLEQVHERSMEAWVRPALLILGRIAADRGQWEDAARYFGGCRPHLPPWGQHRRWWNFEPVVRSALGENRYWEIAARAENEPLDELVAWALESDRQSDRS